jgi:hypothetical protein
MNIHRVSDVRQIEIQTCQPSIPDPSPFEDEIAIAKLQSCKSAGSVQIPAELIQAGSETLRSGIHKHIKFFNKRNCLISGRNLLLCQFKRTVVTVVIIVGYHCYQLHAKFYIISFPQV